MRGGGASEKYHQSRDCQVADRCPGTVFRRRARDRQAEGEKGEGEQDWQVEEGKKGTDVDFRQDRLRKFAVCPLFPVMSARTRASPMKLAGLRPEISMRTPFVTFVAIPEEG